jgi:hypothetical protein
MNIRTRGMLQFLGSGVVFATALWWFMAAQQRNPGGALPGGPFGLIVLAAPGGFAAAGLVQWISGVPFSELSEKWNSLKGWQRGVFGTLVFFGGLLLLLAGLVLYGFLTAG